MLGRRKGLQIFLIALIVSLLLGGCGGGSTGKTWFNLPSIPLSIQPDGSAKVLGFNIGPLLQPQMLQQLQAGNVQKLEVRIGYKGIFIMANGQALPYIAWDEQSSGQIGEILKAVPGIPNPDMIAGYLPMLRQIGMGAVLKLPVAEGQSAIADMPRWSGEVEATKEEAPATPTIGPLNLSALAFAPDGTASLAGIPLSELGAGVALPPNVQQILQGLKAEKLSVKTTPNGVQLSINDKLLPSLAYDSKSLGTLNDLLGKVGPGLGLPADTVSMIGGILPKLTGAAINADVSLTGQPAGKLELGSIPVTMNPDGTMSAYGLPLGGSPLLPADVIAKLQAANVQNLGVSVEGNSIILAANGQVLPTLSYDQASLASLTQLAQSFGLPEQQLTKGLELVRNIVEQTPLGLSINLGGGEAAPAAIDAMMKPADLKGMAAPVIHLTAGFDANGALQSVGDLKASDLASAGLPLTFSLPPNVMQGLSKMGAKEVSLTSEPNKLNLQLDGKTAMTIGFDEASLRAALSLAQPFLGETPLSDPNLAKFIDEQILPIAAGADLDVDLQLQ